MRVRAQGARWRALVIGYHNVAPTPFWPGPSDAGVRGLAEQVRWLGRMGTIVPLRHIVAAMTEGRPLPRRAIALTFDDGYRDNAEAAMPLLDRMGVPATFFLVPGFLDGDVPAWWEVTAWAVRHASRPMAEVAGHSVPGGDLNDPRVGAFMNAAKTVDAATRERRVAELVDGLAPAGDNPLPGLFMDWDAARAMAGRMDIGSHTQRHAILSRETASGQTDDLRGARSRLQAELGIPVDLLAYPNGQPDDVSADTVAATRAAGHAGAVTTVDGWTSAQSDALMVPRFVLDPASGRRGLRKLVRSQGFARFLASGSAR